MKAKLLLLTAAMAAVLLHAYGARPAGIAGGFGEGHRNERTAPKKTVLKKADIRRDDTLYCTEMEAPMIWPEPLDTMSREDAARMRFAMRLSERNKKGHFGRLEILDRGLRPGTYQMENFMKIFLPDSLINPEVATLELSRIDFLSDASGDFVEQERYYGIDNTLLFIISRNRIRETPPTFREHYFGPLGLPVSMTVPDAGYSGMVEEIFVLDSARNGKVVYLADEESIIIGQRGEMAVASEFNRRERVKTELYVDRDHNPIVGFGGYAMKKTFYGEGMRQDSIAFYGPDGARMAVREDAPDPKLRGVSKQVWLWNGPVSLSEQRNYGCDNEPVNDGYGTHRLKFVGDNYGYVFVHEAEDADGNPAPGGPGGWSRWEMRQDSQGRMLEYHQYGLRGEPVSDGDEASSIFMEYAPDGSVSYSRYMDAKDGVESLFSEIVCDGPLTTTRYGDGSVRTELRDGRGRLVKAEVRDSAGRLSDGVDVPLDVYDYVTRDDSSVVSTNREYDSRGRLRFYARNDSAAGERLFMRYDSLGYLTEGYLLGMSDTWNGAVRQGSVNRFGTVTRTTSVSAPLGYMAGVEYTLNGDTHRFYGIDEFGEPEYMSYFSPNRAMASFYYRAGTGEMVCMDEDGNKIADMDEFVTHLPKYMSVEVTDSAAYALGLRDNDVILRYGKSYAPARETTAVDFAGRWTVAEVLEANRSKRVAVFRIDSVEPVRFSVHEFELPAGTSHDLGFVAHPIYRTRRQNARILVAMEDAGLVPDAMPYASDTTIYVAAYPLLQSNLHTLPYAARIGAPSVLFGLECVELPDVGWRCGRDLDEMVRVLKFCMAEEEPALHCRALFYDGQRLGVFELDSLTFNELLSFSVVRGPQELHPRVARRAELEPLKSDVHFGAGDRCSLAKRLVEYGFYDAALRRLDRETVDSCGAVAEALSALACSHIRNDRKAAGMRRKAARRLVREARGDADAEILLSRLYAFDSRARAAESLAEAINASEITDDVIRQYRDIYKMYTELSNYSVDIDPEVQGAFLDGSLRMAEFAAFVGVNPAAIARVLLDDALSVGHLHTRWGDSASFVHDLLRKFLPSPTAPMEEVYRDFFASHLCTFDVLEDADMAAYSRGMRGTYIIIKVNDWTPHSVIPWADFNLRNRGKATHLVVMTPEGKVEEYDFEGLMGLMYGVKKFDGATVARARQLIQERIGAE